MRIDEIGVDEDQTKCIKYIVQVTCIFGSKFRNGPLFGSELHG